MMQIQYRPSINILELRQWSMLEQKCTLEVDMTFLTNRRQYWLDPITVMWQSDPNS